MPGVTPLPPPTLCYAIPPGIWFRVGASSAEKISVIGGDMKVDDTVNRTRVAKWRAKKSSQGYRGLTVYLSPETLRMLIFLRQHFCTRRKTAELISRAIRNLYEQIHRNE